MRSVERSEILDFVTYGERREQMRALAMQAKAARRVEVGEHFVFLFENRETVRHQVHEMMRAERLVKEADILHELETYNELLGGAGELGATLLIGIEDAADRDVLLRAWVGVLDHIYVELDDGSRIGARWDSRQVGDDRLSSVQYLAFPVGPRAPRAVGIAMAGVEAQTLLTAGQRAALQADLDEP